MSVYARIKTALDPLKILLNMITFVGNNKPDEYIVYSIIDSPNKTSADGRVTGVSTRVQIDYMTRSPNKLSDIGGKIEKNLLDAGFMRVGNPRDNYDTSSRYYYRQQDFRYYERRD
jgi:hypothetical protein